MIEMRISTLQTVALLLLSTFLPAAQAQVKLIYTFDYSFFSDTVQNAPSLTDFNTLICLKDEYMTEVYREMSGNNALVFESTNIDWSFFADELNVDGGVPLEVTIAAEVTSTDGSEVPSPDAMSLYSPDLLDFIQRFLHTSDSSVWTNVGGMSSSYDIDVPAQGQLDKGVCDGTFQDSNAADVTRPPRETPTDPPTPAPTPPAVQVVLAAIEFQFLEGSAREPTPEELDNLMCLTDDYMSAWMANEIGDPSTTVKGRVLQFFLNPDQTVWVMIAQNVTAGRAEIDPTLVQKEINEYTRLNVVEYIENYVWKTMDGSVFRDTTSTKFSATISNDPILEGLEETCGSKQIGVPAVEEETDMTLAPTGVPSTSGPSAPLSPTQVPSLGGTQTPTTGGDATIVPTVFQTSTEATGGPTSFGTEDGSDASGTEEDDALQAVLFKLEFAFEEGTGRMPSGLEADNMLCRVDEFFIDVMQFETGDDTIVTYSTSLGAYYEEGLVFPYILTVVFNTTTTNGEEVDPEVVVEVINVVDEDSILLFIENYVANTTEDDVFINTIAANFTSEIIPRETVPLGPIWFGSCPEPRDTELDIATPSPETTSPSDEGTSSSVTTAEGVTFVLNFGLEDGTELRSPTQAEVEDLMCQTDRFFTEHMQNVTEDTTIDSYGTFIDWELNPDNDAQPVKVTFLSQSFFGADQQPVPIETVVNVMDPTVADFLLYIEDYVFATAEDNIFQRTTSVSFEGFVNEGPPLGDLERATCSDETPSPTGSDATPSPTVPAVSPTAAPSQLTGETPGPTPGDGENPNPTSSPTSEATDTKMPITSSPTMVPSVGSPAPTRAPSQQQSIPPAQFQSTGIFPVRTSFLVSNLEGLKDANDVRFSAGLDIAWKVFATEMVANVTRHWREAGNRRLETEVGSGHRFLTIERVPNSAKVTGVTETECGPTDHLNATCLTIEAEYQYSIVQEVYYFLNELFISETDAALTNGTLQFILERESPGTPLVVGNIPRDESPTTVPSANTPAPTRAPVVAPSQQESIPPAQVKSTGIFPVRTAFLMSNLNGLKETNDVRFNAGLDKAWSVFATEIVANVTRHWREAGNRRLETEVVSGHRILSIQRVPNSAKVTGVTETQCGPTDHLEATCLTIEAEYQYDIVREVYYFLNELFISETDAALKNGTFQFILERESPGTPLVVGNIPRDAIREYATSDGGADSGSNGDGGGGGDKGGLAGWAIFLIVLLVLLLVCVPLALYVLAKQREDDKPILPPYQEEDFVYDFRLPPGMKLQTEVDDVEEARNKAYGVEAAPRDSSTASSDFGPADGFVYDQDEDDYDDWEEEENMNRGQPQGGNYYDDDDEDWEEEDNRGPQVGRSIETNGYDDQYHEDQGENYDGEDGNNQYGDNDQYEDDQPYDENNQNGYYDDNPHYQEQDNGHEDWANEGEEEGYDDTEALLLEQANNTLALEHAENTHQQAQFAAAAPSAPSDEDWEDEGDENAPLIQGGGQQSQEGDPAWTGYDDHLRGLKDIGSSHRNDEESISFGDEDEDDDSTDGNVMVVNMLGGSVHDNQDNFDSAHGSRAEMSMESEGGWEDTSGASSHASSHSGDLWA